MIALSKYSFGIGDRFAQQANAQLKAFIQARKKGVEITPVWNKSFREHKIIGSDSFGTRLQAELAVDKLGWKGTYLLDADHIRLDNVDFFVHTCDYFTLDVADDIGKPGPADGINRFVQKYKKYCGKLQLPQLELGLEVTSELIEATAKKYLAAAQSAAQIYQHILKRKEGDPFVVEISMDETDEVQTPQELFFILAALAEHKIPLQTIAPKFSGRFNKGIDYVGDLAQFKKEFEQDVAVLQLAVKEFDLPADLKLSIHSGSDKFSIYPIIRETIRRFDAGLHVKTAGTTWLEELIGLAEAGGPGLAMAKDIYRGSLERIDELCAPYANVLDIDRTKLPTADTVSGWSRQTFVETLRHDPENPAYNKHVRQLLHVGYKVAAEMGRIYLSALKDNRKIISKNVTHNIFERHIKALFL